MQKKFIYSAVAFSLLLSPVLLVQAQINTIQNSASTTRGDVQARVEAVRTLIGEHKDAMRARLLQNKETLQEHMQGLQVRAQARFSEGAQRSVNNIINALGKAVDRLEIIAEKTDEHIERFEAAGANMSTSTSLLALARADIGDAQVKVDAVAAALEIAVESETPKGEMANIRAAIQAAQEALRTARESLKEILRSIRTEGTR